MSNLNHPALDDDEGTAIVEQVARTMVTVDMLDAIKPGFADAFTEAVSARIDAIRLDIMAAAEALTLPDWVPADWA